MTGKLCTRSGKGDTGKQSDLCRQVDGVWAPAPLLISDVAFDSSEPIEPTHRIRMSPSQGCEN